MSASNEDGRSLETAPPVTTSPLPRQRLPGTVIALGLVSLFADISSEMVYPLLPFFLSGVLGASTVAIGIIEGIAESTATTVNLFSGWLSDHIGKRKGLAMLGYTLAALMRPVVGISAIWQQVLGARFIDRVGKGIRTSPRDALVASSAPPELRGKAFGIQRSLDHTGAVLGPLVAMALLFLMTHSLMPEKQPSADTAHALRTIFKLAVIPGLIAVVILWFGVKEKPPEPGAARKGLPTISFRSLRGPFGVYCLVATLFAVGNSSNMFLLLRAQNLGLGTGLIPAAYVLMYIVAAILSTPAGILSDRLGRRGMLMAGFCVSALVYAGFGLTGHAALTWLLFAGYGLYIALTDGMQRAYAADLAPKEILGTAMGTFNAMTGIALLPASFIAGWLWNLTPTHAWPFWYGAVTSIAAAVLLFSLPPGGKGKPKKG